MAELPILYSFRRCPYAMRARLGIQAAALSVELREIILRDKPAEMLAASPKGTVPILVLPGSRVIDESLDIMHWALAQNDPLGWLAGNDPELIAENDGPFKAALDRYKYPHRYGLANGNAHRDEAAQWLETLDARLTVAPWLSGAREGLADWAILPFIRQFAATDVEWFSAQDWPKLQSWLADLLDRPEFEAVMAKYARWTPGDEVVVF